MSGNTENLDYVIGTSIEGLKNDFKLINGGNNGGWHQFFGSHKVGNVATAQAMLLLHEFQDGFVEKTKTLNFLLKNQLHSDLTNNNGGWSFISNVPGIANTESTSWVLQALINEFKVDNIQIQKGLKWLKLNFIANSTLSGWGPTKECEIRTYSTCIALNTLNKLGANDTYEFISALDSLKRMQNEDGGWGETLRGTSTLTHTAHAAITLMSLGIAISSRNISMAIDWITKILEAKIYENGFHMGYSEMFDLKYSNGQEIAIQRLIFYHMPLPYAILALIKAESKNHKLIYEIVTMFMNSSDYGIWWHPLLLEKPLWAVYDVLTLFKHFKTSSCFAGFNSFTPKIKSKKKFDVIIFTVVPVEFLTLNKILAFAPSGKREDYSKKGYWYYEYILERPKGKSLSCLITMIGSAGDIGCYAACSTTFEEFDCDLAILCGIAAGNKNDISKYDVIIADSIVAYEYQRLEENKIVHRPKQYSVDGYVKKVIEKKDYNLVEWMKLVQEFTSVCGIKIANVKNYTVESTKLKTGTIASGAKLIADGKTLEILKENIPIEKGIIAADMEGSGFAPCCREYNKEWLVIRGISDYGENDKNDTTNKEQQPVSVATAAATMIYFLKYLHRTYEEREV